ncbi:pseudouridine synthase [Ampelomyces quisqualis]|uniref:Pseudouridine synthase n=1 Tax=Ampelomyces quisqualis TaxID=50730 RepID=A0A6A5QK95_AMPQU|nr:pseudouridine synthase [Ampelomyces quisqualis]
MSDHADDSARPAKRARLDDSSSAPVLTCAQAPHAAADTDVEREVRAGITEYVCPDNLGFSGVLKQRYTDFLVNEIGLDGEVRHLKSTDVPGKEKKRDARQAAVQESTVGEKVAVLKEETGDATMLHVRICGEEVLPKSEAPAHEAEVKQENGEVEVELAQEDRTTLHDIFGDDITKQIVKLVGQVRRREHRKAKDFKAVIAPPITDKEKRTQAHQSLRRIFPNLLESSMEADQSLRIKATPPAERKGKNNGRGGGRERGDGPSKGKGQLAWEELGGEYLHFTLYKENKDTMEIISFLGSKLGGGGKLFGFAGTKDRRACTVQRVCVKRQTAERMHSFNRVLYNSAMGDWKYEPYNLTLGDLKGNEFTITLRDCHFQGEEGLDFAQRRQLADDLVSKAISDFSEKGFINYYGLQRFGSFATSTDAIGRKMLQDDLSGAVADILAYTDTALAAAEGNLPADSNLLVSQDDRNRAKALHIWATQQKCGAALDLLPRKFTAERNIIQHLSSRNSRTGAHDRRSDWQGALMTIPRNLRLMYVHAYQSLVWNVVAGHRWSIHGDSVVEGDLVLVHEHLDKLDASAPAVKPEDTDANGEMIINPSGSENANSSAQQFERARPLTSSEASSGKYTIWDVVLPQPGFDVEYPANSIGEFYSEFMKSEKGGGLDPNNMRRGWREVSLSGGYRKFLAKPFQPLSYQIHAYDKDEAQFVTTDLQRLTHKARHEPLPVENGHDAHEETHDAQEHNKTKLAVVLTLQLASSQYATMALRELMKAGGVTTYKPEFMGGR